MVHCLSPTRSHRGIGLLLLTLLCGCRESATLVLIDVVGKDGVASPPTRAITNIEGTFIQGTDRRAQILSPKITGTTIDLPTSFVLRADGREGPMQLDLKAKDANQTLGEGSISTTLVKDQQSELTAVLFPDDFGVNENRQGAQFFSFEAGFGRQVAADREGNFVVVWEDACSGTLVRCDIYYRLFNTTGTPKLNGNTGKYDEAIANETTTTYDMPSVAMQDTGGFVIAWQRRVGTIDKIFSRTFTSDGRVDTSSNGGAEVELSGTEVSASVVPSVPHAVALRDKGYLVVWQQKSGTTWEIKARYLSSSGVPAPTYGGGKDPILVHSFTASAAPASCGDGKCDAGETCMNCGPDCGGSCGPWPVAAAGAAGNQGFLVVWNQDGLIRGHTFGPRAEPIKVPFDVDTLKTRQVRDVAAASLPGGYAAVWTDVVPTFDTDGTCVRIRRMDVNGGPVLVGEQEFTVNTSYAGNQKNPAAAMRADGSLLVIWANEHPDPDPDGGIRGRLLLPNLLPVGQDFPVNTTLVGKQDAPALAVHASDSFITVFVDSSRTYPDQFDTAIRGRLLYPDFSPQGAGPQDGQLGYVCDESQHRCAQGLNCTGTEPGPTPRCLANCSGEGMPCPQGGLCRRLAGEESKLVCLFR